MEALNKNKEEIEKILNGCGYCGNKNLCPECRIKLQERIKTSILWCEDEIIYLAKKMSEFSYVVGYFDFTKDKHSQQLEVMKEQTNDYLEKLEQLHTHLNWLKEKEKNE